MCFAQGADVDRSTIAVDRDIREEVARRMEAPPKKVAKPKEEVKDEAKEVVSGLECGLHIENFNDIKVGDMVEAYEVTTLKKTL